GFPTFNPPGGAVGVTVAQTQVVGSAALSQRDQLLFNVYDTRNDPGGVAMPDRIYAVRDQYAINTASVQSQTGQTGAVVNWMFAPTNGGTYGTDTFQPRLNSKDVIQAGVVTQFKAIGSPAVFNDT